MATLVKNGRYFSLQFYSPNRTPARKRISLRVEKKRDALRLKSLLESRYACGEIDPWVSTLRPPYWGREALRVTKQVTVQEGFLEFLESREGCREATILHYRWILSLFSRFVGPETDINDLSSASVLSWLGTSTTNTHTRYTYYSRLKVAFRYLVKIGRLNSNPCELVVVSKPSENLSAKCVSEEQLAKIVEYASDSDTPYLADVAIVTFDLALRLGEICALKGSWLEE
ncbi:MAG: tyrosine-type recombinase/integrase, partial [Rhodothermales bacterium]